MFDTYFTLEVCIYLCFAGTEELAHLEIVAAILHQLTKNLSIEEIKKLTLEDIEAMTILELARLKIDDVNHFSAAELNMISKTFEEKRMTVTEEELRKYINEFYLKDRPELAQLADDVMKLFAASKELEKNAKVSEETKNNINAMERANLSQTYENDKLMQSYAYVNHFQAYLTYGNDSPERDVFYQISKSCYQHIATYLITTPIFLTE